MCHIKETLQKDFVCALKANRLAALSEEDYQNNRFTSIEDLPWQEESLFTGWLKDVSFPVLLVRQVFTNKDGSTGILYLACSDTTVNREFILTTYQKRWPIEVFHKSLKQNAALGKAPVRRIVTQNNHVFAALYAFFKFVEQPQTNASNLHEESERIEKDLERINAGCQWLITLARKGSITTSDMEQQLATLTLQEISHKRDLASLGQTINISLLDNWEAKFEEYLADLRTGVDELKNAAPQTEEERHNLFLLKKQVVDTLVERVTIGKDRELKVEIRLDLLAILDNDVSLVCGAKRVTEGKRTT